MHATFFTTPQDLWTLIGTAAAPQIIDARRDDSYAAAPAILPISTWRDPADVAAWAANLDRSRRVIVACKAGHERSQSATACLRAQGFAASVLVDGYAGWTRLALPLVAKAALERFAPRRPSLWVTRRRPKIDRIACPWLIRRFIDADAKILFVDPPQVATVARETGATPFDIDDIALSHEGERCSFDTMLRVFGLEPQPELAKLAHIVRGADTARHDLAPEAAGLHAVSLGLSALAGDDDHGLLERAFVIYDALFAWLRFAAQERHNWPARPPEMSA
ncbi:MAG: chromate resistance protein [Proteobacteria bacterium]|nr:chromate resistance protein [Pseudomonadota bacterium]